MVAIIILSVLATIIATVLAYIYIIPKNRRGKLNKPGQFLHDALNFRFLIIEKIVQFSYVVATAFCICGGFFMLFWFEQSYIWGYYGGYYTSQWRGWIGLLLMLLGPIAVRIVYELAMMGILLVKNTIQINNKLKNQNGSDDSDPFAEKSAAQYAPFKNSAAPKNFCINCGAALEPDGTCPNCK